jgi:hypothetical protein
MLLLGRQARNKTTNFEVANIVTQFLGKTIAIPDFQTGIN